jgi:hypothetical protein
VDGAERGEVDVLRALVASLRTTRPPTWLTPALDPEAVTAELGPRIGEVVPGAHAVSSIRLRDARARRAWALGYDAEVLTDEGTRAVVLVAERPVPGAAARSTGVLLPGLGLTVAARDHDPGLPALPVLTDPDTARPVLEDALRDGRPGLTLAGVEPRLLQLKAGHRATVLEQLSYPPEADPSWPRAVIAKTYSDTSGASTYGWMQGLWQGGMGGDGVPRLAEPLAYLPEHLTLLQGVVPGDRTLADLVADHGNEASSVDSAVRGTAEGLAALHRSGVTTGPPRTVGAEVATIERLLTRLEPSLPEQVSRDARTLLTSLAGRGGVGPARHVPVHGAFRPAQVLLDGTRPAFLDFDGFGQGEAALDVGRFLAKLTEIAGRERRDHLARMFVDTYRETAALPAERLSLWLCLDLFIGTVRCWYRADPVRATVLLDLLDHALTSDW